MDWNLCELLGGEAIEDFAIQFVASLDQLIPALDGIIKGQVGAEMLGYDSCPALAWAGGVFVLTDIFAALADEQYFVGVSLNC